MILHGCPSHDPRLDVAHYTRLHLLKTKNLLLICSSRDPQGRDAMTSSASAADPSAEAKLPERHLADHYPAPPPSPSARQQARLHLWPPTGHCTAPLPKPGAHHRVELRV
jgi:hypothetical protein